MSVSRVQSVSRLLYKAPVWNKANALVHASSSISQLQ